MSPIWSQLGIGVDSYLSRLYSPANLNGDVAMAATGLTQQQLDALSATYNVHDNFAIARRCRAGRSRCRYRLQRGRDRDHAHRDGDRDMTLIDSFDQGGTWDSGLQWDVNVGPNPGNIAPYLALVTSEHNKRPKYMAMLAMLVQALTDCTAVADSLVGLFDIDTAVGAQLDMIGDWVGVTRNITVPLTGVFFSWSTAGLGWDQGSWTTGINVDELVLLSDDDYRTLLRARIAANNWDGTIPGAYSVWDIIFAGTGFGILIQDLEDMAYHLRPHGPRTQRGDESSFYWRLSRSETRRGQDRSLLHPSGS